MRKYVLSSLAVTAAGLLLFTLQTGAAEKLNPNDPVLICQQGCKTHTNNEAYEACMLKCKESQKSSTPAASITPANKK